MLAGNCVWIIVAVAMLNTIDFIQVHILCSRVVFTKMDKKCNCYSYKLYIARQNSELVFIAI